MARPRLIGYALALLAVVGLGWLGGLGLAAFTLAGVDPFYRSAPLPGPLVAAPEPGPVVAPPPPVAAPPPDWAYPEARIDRIGYDPGLPDPALDDDPVPPPEPLLVVDGSSPDAPPPGHTAPAAPVTVVAAPPPVAVTQATGTPR